MLKRKLSKSEFEALEPAIQALYKAAGGDFKLNVEDDPSVAELTKANKELQEEVLLRANFVDPADVPDIAAVNAELEAERAARSADVSKYQGVIGESLISAKAVEIAGKISKSPTIMKRFVQDMLTVDFSGDAAVVKVKGPDGNPSDLTFDDLSKDLVANADFADIIIGTRATGGGNQTGQQTQSQFRPQSGEADADLSKAPLNDIVARVEAKLAARAAQ